MLCSFLNSFYLPFFSMSVIKACFSGGHFLIVKGLIKTGMQSKIHLSSARYFFVEHYWNAIVTRRFAYLKGTQDRLALLRGYFSFATWTKLVRKFRYVWVFQKTFSMFPVYIYSLSAIQLAVEKLFSIQYLKQISRKRTTKV